MNAVSKIKSNLNNFIKKKYKIFSKIEPLYKNGNIYVGNRVFNFDEIIKEAYLNRISLSSSGFYSTPKINFNKRSFLGRPFLYFCYGASVSEVTVDPYTNANITTYYYWVKNKTTTPQIDSRISDTATSADAFLLIFSDNLYTTGSASADKTTATNKSKISDLTLRNIKTEIEINRTYKKALFNSSCRVSPFGRFTII